MISYANSIPGQPPPTQLISSLVQSLLKNNKNEAAASFYLLPVSLFQYRAEITYFVGSTLKTVIIHPRVRSCRVVLPPPRFSSSHRRAIKRSVETVSWELRSIEIRAVSSCSANPSSKDDASPCNERSTPVLSRKSSFIPPRFSNRSFFFSFFRGADFSRAPSLRRQLLDRRNGCRGYWRRWVPVTWPGNHAVRFALEIEPKPPLTSRGRLLCQ